MGKKRIAEVGQETKRTAKIAGLKGGQRVVDMSMAAEKEQKPVAEKEAPVEATQKEEVKKTTAAVVKKPRARSKAYRASQAKLEPNKLYPLLEAIKLLKETSLAKFSGSAEAHFNTKKKGISGEAKLPYFAGKAKKVVIADEKILEQIAKGKIDFGVLLATPALMPKIVPLAKILGPKGLMPNPKNGTIVEKPEEARKNFSQNSLSFKTEKDFPLIHVVFGKISQKEKELEENLAALIKAIGAGNIKKLVIKATMGPGIKVGVTSI
ncbi:hypothetical protein FJZ40_01085 [Candidatus Shapirobacteria bacterium]|nr:hypothetical protein [Candidatus Shapirobacteria bacterium]